MHDTEVKIISDNTFDVVKSAVNKMVDFIRPTYGPASNKVIVSKVLNKMVIDDGVQIARDFELPDPSENAVVNVVREVAIRTNDRVGDGTTSSLIMLQGIINEVSRKRRWDGRKIELELKKGVEEVSEYLRKQKHAIKSREDLEKVARISFDDKEIAKMIADTYFKLGPNGILTVEKSPTAETSVKLSDGITLDRGYISPYMVTNPERMETEFDKPYILVTDYRLTEAKDVIGLLEMFAKEKLQNLVIIAENVEQYALSTMVINQPHIMNPQTKQPGVLRSIAITAPSSTGDSKVALEDIALMLGARMVSLNKGDKVEEVTIEDLGRADKIIVKEDETVIIGPKGKKGDVASAVTSLRSAIQNETKPKSKEKLEKRLALFENTIAVIKVGATTENEQKALKYKVEDSVNAVRQAFQGGVVCGAGLSLARLKTSSPILNEALQYPARQLRENMALDGEPNLDPEQVENVVTGQKGKALEVGVIDPVEVLIAGVESAISIASVLLTSTGMIVESQRKPKIEG